MKCPFLQETSANSCARSSQRKLIPRTDASHELCSSRAFRDCRIYMGAGEDNQAECCPYFTESLVQFCSAAPVTRFIPYSESPLSRCGTDAFRYCEAYIELAGAGQTHPEVDGIEVPERLGYTPNHMWVDPVSEDLCFIGLDGFAARAFGPIDRISFAVDAGTRPTAILNVNGVDFSMVFPSATTAVQQNSRLRAAPERLTAQPYIAGWLFQAASPPSGFAGLMQGAAAQRWISAEVERLSRAVHERCAPGADGGIFEPAILRHVDRETALVLFHEFFSPYATWTR